MWLFVHAFKTQKKGVCGRYLYSGGCESHPTTTIEYFYTDGIICLQTFYSDETLPIEIPLGQSDDFEIPFTLPNNIAP